MVRHRLRNFVADHSGAVAGTYALALAGLVVTAGVGFDYARMATMDSELQAAADQAALAAATQLDGSASAITNATNRASDLVSNESRLANGSSTITVASVTFFTNKTDAEANTNATTDSASARYVRVQVNSKRVYYAFTPIVGALASPNVAAAATAGLGSAICKVPPVMMCNPAESTDSDFTVSNYIGKGILLIANTGASAYGPGNFGYLDANAGNGAQAVSNELGRTTIPGDCVAADSVDTKPGEQVSVLDALNTRFDIYANGLNNTCDQDNSLCAPSANSRKDVMQKSPGCDFTTGNGAGWQEAPHPYVATSATTPLTNAYITANTLSPMGYPRDMCHSYNPSTGCTGGRVGDGNWDRNAYFTTNSQNYPSGFDIAGTFGTSTPTRYQVYKYEAANAATRLQPQTDGTVTSQPQPVCYTPGIAVGGTTTVPDRRVLSVAVINCTAEGVSGSKSGVHVKKWIDIFLVEPALNRPSPVNTSQADVYVEVIGQTGLGGGSASSTPQFVRRDKPYLVN